MRVSRPAFALPFFHVRFRKGWQSDGRRVDDAALKSQDNPENGGEDGNDGAAGIGIEITR